jgi:hypothetical protein
MPKIHRDRPPTSRFDIVAQVPPKAEIPEPPSVSARKDVWVAYAKALWFDATNTKSQIIERVTGG